MKSLTDFNFTITHRRRTLRGGLTILPFLIAGSLAAAGPSPSPTPKKPPTASPSPTKPPQTAPTPDTKLDAKTEAELLLAEDRFVTAILERDLKVLEELLSDHYADSFGKYAKRAVSKRGVIARVSGADFPAYRVEKKRKLTHSVGLFTVEGLAKRHISGVEPGDKWFQVRRLWTKTGDRWVLNGQIIVPQEEPSAEKDAKAQGND